MTEDPWLTPEEVAERLKVKRKTLWNWRRLGAGPPWVQFGPPDGVGGTLRIRLSVLENWENERAAKGA